MQGLVEAQIYREGVGSKGTKQKKKKYIESRKSLSRRVLTQVSLFTRKVCAKIVTIKEVVKNLLISVHIRIGQIMPTVFVKIVI